MALTEQQQLNKNINPFLTNYAQGYTQPELIYPFVIPQVDVTVDSITYQKNGKDGFKIIDSKRAPGADPKVVGYNTDVDTATLIEHSLEGRVDKQAMAQAERYQAGRGQQLKLDAQTLTMGLMLLEREKEAADLLSSTSNFDSTCRSALTSTDCWSDYTNSNPIKAILAAKEVVRSKGGMYPNVLVLGATSWATLSQHPVILDRIKYAQLGVTTENLVAQILGLDKIVVGKAVYSTDAGVITDVWGDIAVLMYIPSNLQSQNGLYGQPLHSVGFNLLGYPQVEEYDGKVAISEITYMKYKQVCVSTYNGYLFTNVNA